ncbi:hypothetical protein [Novosphingobium sp. FSW06-99]|uniref:hypothetical protein n=1 Tax=Novosphingobium sp. FSW06-99 TaxID=1739113 RepID=UPI00076CBEB1|nr:hypothetical protein [Novosphingobium sp. FSW06-99]KUR77748.1 hypothetical protein AQZ49_09660 [Novosphingobium sp. FSW06-99]
MKWIVTLTLLLSPTMALPSEVAPDGALKFANQVIAYDLSNDANISDSKFLAFLSPRLRAAFVRDDHLNDHGYLEAYLDHDPICMCQDNGNLKISIVSIKGGSDAAEVQTQVAGADGVITHGILWLKRGKHGWMIADISELEAGICSLLSNFEHHNSPLRKRH